VLTIEGVATGDTLHPMQEAFRNNHALQCGFCTPGMVMSALGACVVHVDGEAVKACTLLALQAEGRSVLTIEAVATGDTLHPMQEAFRNNHALQCGFCTPGMVMSALDLVKNNPNPTEREIREYLEGNLCRCTGYHNIVLAIAEGAAVMRGEAPPNVHGAAAE